MIQLFIVIAAIWAFFALVIVPIMFLLTLKRFYQLEAHQKVMHDELVRLRSRSTQTEDFSLQGEAGYVPPPPPEPEPTLSPAMRFVDELGLFWSTPKPEEEQTDSKDSPNRGDRDVALIARWAPIVGGLFLLFSAVFFGAHFFPHTPPPVRFGLMLLGTGVVYSLGFWAARKELPYMGQVLHGAGLACLYLTSIAGYVLPPVKITDSLVVAALMQAVALIIIMGDSIRRRQEIMATCTLGFGFASVLMLYQQGFFEGILPSGLVLGMFGVLLYRRFGWLPPAIISILLSFALYTWFSTINWVDEALVDQFQIILFPILLAAGGVAILHGEQRMSSLGLRSALVILATVLGGIINLVFLRDSYSWFALPATGLLAVWGGWEFSRRQAIHGGLAALAATVLLLSWISSEFSGLASAFLSLLVAAFLAFVQRVSNSKRVQSGFLLALTATLIHLLYQAYQFDFTSADSTTILFDWNALGFLGTFLGLCLLFCLSREPLDSHKTLREIYRIITPVLGAAGAALVLTVLNPESWMIGITLVGASLFAFGFIGKRSLRHGEYVLLMIGAIICQRLVFEGELNLQQIIGSSAFLALLWVRFTLRPQSRIFTAIALTIVSFTLLPYYLSPATLLLPIAAIALLAILHEKGLPLRQSWSVLPALSGLLALPSALKEITRIPSGRTPIISDYAFFFNPNGAEWILLPILLFTLWGVHGALSSKLSPQSIGSGPLSFPSATGIAFFIALLASLAHFESTLPFDTGLLMLFFGGAALILSHKKGFLMRDAEYIALLPLLLSFAFWENLAMSAVTGRVILAFAIASFTISRLRRNQSSYDNLYALGIGILITLQLIYLIPHYGSGWIAPIMAMTSAIFLITGLMARLHSWRILGLALFPVIVGWILIVDLEDTIARLLATTGLALAALLVGLLYQLVRKTQRSRPSTT